MISYESLLPSTELAMYQIHGCTMDCVKQLLLFQLVLWGLWHLLPLQTPQSAMKPAEAFKRLPPWLSMEQCGREKVLGIVNRQVSGVSLQIS